jgi:hypothetical protein
LRLVQTGACVAHSLLRTPTVVRFIAVLVVAGGCVVPYAIPPLRGELGAATATGRDPAVRYAGGAHLASATLRRDQPIDLGVGGFVETGKYESRDLRGVYADASVFVDRGRRTRTALGVRGELAWDAMGSGAGAKLRVDHEIFGATTAGYSGSDTCAVIAGTARGTGAFGVYVETGHAWLAGDRTAWTTTAGITIRAPATVGILAGIPGCR